MSVCKAEKATCAREVRSILFKAWSFAVDEAGAAASKTSRPSLVKGISFPGTDIPFLETGRVLETSMALDDHHLIF